MTEELLQIQLNITEPELISILEQKDQLRVQIVQNYYFYSEELQTFVDNKEAMKEEIP